MLFRSNMKRVMNIMGVGKFLEAMRAVMARIRASLVLAAWLLGALRRLQDAIWRFLAAIRLKIRLRCPAPAI